METLLIIKIIAALIFGLAVFGKVTGKTKIVFDQAGYATWVMHSTAIAEFIFAALLFTKYELVATIGLLGIMGGALFTLIRLKEKPSHYILPIVTIILLLALLGIQLPKSGILPG